MENLEFPAIPGAPGPGRTNTGPVGGRCMHGSTFTRGEGPAFVQLKRNTPDTEMVSWMSEKSAAMSS